MLVAKSAAGAAARRIATIVVTIAATGILASRATRVATTTILTRIGEG
jgi:hypothetical protein